MGYVTIATVQSV